MVAKKPAAFGKNNWRMATDYKALNAKTIDDNYLLPNITDVLNKLGRCQYFTSIDLASGFHHIEMSPDDVKKTTFTRINGH